MKKMFIVGLMFLLTAGIFSLQALTRCWEVPATRGNAGRILDWCDDVTCRHCVYISNTGYDADLEWTECEAECL